VTFFGTKPKEETNSELQVKLDPSIMTTNKTPILEQTPAQLATWLAARGYPTYRAKQVFEWIFLKRAADFAEMTSLPKGLREELSNHFSVFTATTDHQQSGDGTEKLLVKLADGGRIECVLLRDGPRRSICVSSQVGCAMGCVFCASGLDGVERNLTRGEVLEQMLRLQKLLPADERLSHIVMMGMGEPLANITNVLEALEVARDPALGLGISPRRITISTVGLPPAIRKLAEANAPYHLAISLHAPNDPLRTRLVPVNKAIRIAPIMEASEYYFEKTGRRLTFEYVLLKDINDTQECARELIRLLRGRVSMLNVIPYNPVPGLPYETPRPETIHDFRKTLVDGGINVMFRQRKGDSIQAACGQLRRLRERQTIHQLDDSADDTLDQRENANAEELSNSEPIDAHREELMQPSKLVLPQIHESQI
jgi:23S rRNA (adenine2503-C2)-methyltransferase